MQIPAQWLLAILLLFAVVGYGLIVWQREFLRKALDFLVDVKAELKKVTWPNRREVISTTTVVIATVFFFGVFLYIVDVAVTMARNYAFKIGGI